MFRDNLRSGHQSSPWNLKRRSSFVALFLFFPLHLGLLPHKVCLVGLILVKRHRGRLSGAVMPEVSLRGASDSLTLGVHWIGPVRILFLTLSVVSTRDDGIRACLYLFFVSGLGLTQIRSFALGPTVLLLLILGIELLAGLSGQNMVAKTKAFNILSPIATPGGISQGYL
jgi:hypothetical protein